MIFYFLSSLLLVAFGQSCFIPILGVFSSAFGFALFWFFAAPRKERFFLFASWFAIIQAIQFSWVTSTEYMGPLIWVVYFLSLLFLGFQFGCLSFFFKSQKITLLNCFAIAGSWVLLEWMRMFILTGLSWNPVGLSLSSSPYAIQFVSVFGVYGLSFYVIFVNAFVLYSLGSWKKGSLCAFLACFPYLFGIVQQSWVERFILPEKTLSVALVQTGILPEQKDRFTDRLEAFIPPLNQWERIWEKLASLPQTDLIVFPEAAVSLNSHRPFYPIDLVKTVWHSIFGKYSFPASPSKVNNSFLIQMMANHFGSDVIIGMDAQDKNIKYNAAFYFRPQSNKSERYEKRILVPLGEYIPFSQFRWFSEFISHQFGVGDSFSCGTDAKVFSSEVPIGMSICLEEIYSDLLRDLRRNGARLFVNVSNDVWFPRSHLPEHHFQHGRLRAVENGVYVLRSCNTGVTGVIDCCGNVIKTIDSSDLDVLSLDISLKSFQTLYTWWGDWMILSLSLFFVFLRMFRYTRQEETLKGMF